jgi:hypothetical protein
MYAKPHLQYVDEGVSLVFLCLRGPYSSLVVQVCTVMQERQVVGMSVAIVDGRRYL